jgi:DNA-binding transcriptional MocR family regulator
MDIEGRVIRVDSFSKVIAPGSRLGFITAHEVILEKIMNTRESATVCEMLPSSPSRVTADRLAMSFWVLDCCHHRSPEGVGRPRRIRASLRPNVSQ